MRALFNFCKFAIVLSGFVYISYYIEKRKKKGSTSICKASEAVPQFTSSEEAHEYFLSELHTGSMMVQRNDVENGIEHLANAVYVCNKPLELLMMLKSSLPTATFNRLSQRMDELEFMKPTTPAMTCQAILEKSFDALE